MQLPNPLAEESWETEGITDRLVPMRETVTDKTGHYCFEAKGGLWLLKPEVTEVERKEGFKFQ